MNKELEDNALEHDEFLELDEEAVVDEEIETEESAELAADEDEDEFTAGFAGEDTPALGQPDEGAKETPELSDDNTVAEPEVSALEKELSGISQEALDVLAQRLSGGIEEKLSNRLRNLEGNVGGFKAKLDNLATAPEAAAKEQPTTEQITAAATDSESLALLKAEFPEIATAIQDVVTEKTRDMQNFASQQEAAEARYNSTAAELESMRSLRTLDLAVPGWEGDIKSKSYRDWLVTQPQDVIERAENSQNPQDAIEVLSAYRATQTSTKAPSKQSRRLRNSVMPTSGNPTPRARLTEDEEFEAAFKGING